VAVDARHSAGACRHLDPHLRQGTESVGENRRIQREQKKEFRAPLLDIFIIYYAVYGMLPPTCRRISI
jgi:hypothetical protein